MKHLAFLLTFVSVVALADTRVVLVEYSTNASCIPCVQATKSLDQYLQTVGRSRVAVVRYHTPSPNALDPFYQTNKGECDTRASTYGFQTNPQLVLDGVNAGGNTGNWLAGMNYELGRAAPTTLSLSGTYADRRGNVTVTFSVPPPTGTKVFAVVTETGIDFTGANGENTHDDVFQRVLTTWSGLTPTTGPMVIPFALGNDSSLTPEFTHEWDPDSCRIVVWVQNPTTLAVTQAAQIWVSDLVSGVNDASVPGTAALRLFPNPTHDALAVEIGTQSAGTQLTIIDLLGRTLYSASGSAIPRRVNIAQFPAGVYRAVLRTNGTVTASQPIIRN